jgi:hypothetical protein
MMPTYIARLETTSASILETVVVTTLTNTNGYPSPLHPIAQYREVEDE